MLFLPFRLAIIGYYLGDVKRPCFGKSNFYYACHSSPPEDSRPLASPDAVRAVCDQLRERQPDLLLKSEKELLRFLYAVRHIERRPATDNRRGRPGSRRVKT